MAEGFESMAEDIEEEPPNGKGRLSSMISNIKRGLKQELKETRDIPGHISRGDFVSAARQVADIIRMIVLAVVWILPGGMVVSTFLVKFWKNIRPSAFRDEDGPDEEGSREEDGESGEKS